MITSVILAAGKGKRMNSKINNKVVHLFAGKPLIVYGVNLMKKVSQKQIVVIGAFSESVKKTLKNFSHLIFAYQKKRLGTGHALKISLKTIEKNNLKTNLILVGYGDHMMFYQENTIKKFIENHLKNQAVMSLITVFYDNPDNLAWGRIIRDKKTNLIIDSIEQKDANFEQRKIKELNAGFYCFDYKILKKYINKIPKSKITGEYYINSLVKIFADNNLKVVGYQVPFQEVGIGINKEEELEISEKLFASLKK